MKRMLNGFDLVAPFYDFLACLVFGHAIRKAQTCFLQSLPSHGTILIIGGGTGWIANEVLEVTTAKVVYVEASGKMLAASRKRLHRFHDRVVFIHGTHESMPKDLNFDGLITNFFLDLFPDERLNLVTDRLRHTLKETATWIVTDFVNEGRGWQKMLLWIMYRFFTLFAGIEAKRLPDWQGTLKNNGYVEQRRKLFFGGFIRGAVYQQGRTSRFS